MNKRAQSLKTPEPSYVRVCCLLSVCRKIRRRRRQEKEQVSGCAASVQRSDSFVYVRLVLFVQAYEDVRPTS